MAETRAIRQHALGVVETCKTVIAGKSKEPIYIDQNTIAAATEILKQAKEKSPKDTVLAAMTIATPFTWVSIFAAMETVLRSLPLESSNS